MRATVKTLLATVSLVLGLTAAGYAGDVNITGDFFSGPGSTDIIDFDCSKGRNFCAWIRDTGPNFDNVFGVTVSCDADPDIETALAPPGGKVKVCANCPSGVSTVFLFCDVNSPFCDDDYKARLECGGHVTDSDQNQDQ